MKTHFFALAILLMVVTSSTQAEVLRWPQTCQSGELQIKNLKSTSLRVWLQKFKPTLISETEINIKPLAIFKYNLKASSSIERYSVMSLNPAESVEVQFNCNKKTFSAHSFEGGNLTYRISDLPQNQMWIQNLYAGSNTISIEFQNRRFEKLAAVTLSLPAFAQYVYTVPNQIQNWFYIKISAKERYTAFNFNSVGADGPFLVNPQASLVDQKSSYFLLAPRVGAGDSYIVKITKAAMIQTARDQITNPNLEKILFAKIQKGAGGFNRNWSKLEKSFWSWSVSEVTNFADVGSTSCNGVPQAIEDRVDTWIKNPGRICFWNYRVQKELTADEVSTGSTIQ